MESIGIKEVWREHPLYKQGKVALVPTEWVWKYRGTDVSPGVALLDGTISDLDTLWKSLLEFGLHRPLIMRAGLKNKKFRLEAGNHLIQLFRKHGITEVPLTVQVKEECGPHVEDVMTDASHNFDAPEGFLIDTITAEYMNPKEVFPDLKNLKEVYN